jgi:DUF4097 and DUF4098 domain-containing protein YvlB
VSLRGCTGAIEAVTSSGDIDLRGAAGDADVVTSSGTVHLDYARFDAVRTVRAESSSGDIDLVLPRGAGLRLEASTSSGSIDTNLRLPIRERDSGADVAAQIGSGHAFAQLSTSSGDVSVTMR